MNKMRQHTWRTYAARPALYYCIGCEEYTVSAVKNSRPPMYNLYGEYDRQTYEYIDISLLDLTDSSIIRESSLLITH